MSNTARAKAGTTAAETKEIVDFAERLRYVLELKINKLRTIMQESDNHYEVSQFSCNSSRKLWFL
jgi:hypothetical protein